MEPIAPTSRKSPAELEKIVRTLKDACSRITEDQMRVYLQRDFPAPKPEKAKPVRPAQGMEAGLR